MSDPTSRSPGEYEAVFPAHPPQPVPDGVEGAALDAAVPYTGPTANSTQAPPPQAARQVRSARSSAAWWEAPYVFFATFIIFALITPRLVSFLSPTTGDEPFYLMTAISIWNDHDINECNNYRERDEARLYPASIATAGE